RIRESLRRPRRTSRCSRATTSSSSSSTRAFGARGSARRAGSCTCTRGTPRAFTRATSSSPSSVECSLGRLSSRPGDARRVRADPPAPRQLGPPAYAGPGRTRKDTTNERMDRQRNGISPSQPQPRERTIDDDDEPGSGAHDADRYSTLPGDAFHCPGRGARLGSVQYGGATRPARRLPSQVHRRAARHARHGAEQSTPVPRLPGSPLGHHGDPRAEVPQRRGVRGLLRGLETVARNRRPLHRQEVLPDAADRLRDTFPLPRQTARRHRSRSAQRRHRHTGERDDPSAHVQADRCRRTDAMSTRPTFVAAPNGVGPQLPTVPPKPKSAEENGRIHMEQLSRSLGNARATLMLRKIGRFGTVAALVLSAFGATSVFAGAPKIDVSTSIIVCSTVVGTASIKPALSLTGPATTVELVLKGTVDGCQVISGNSAKIVSGSSFSGKLVGAGGNNCLALFGNPQPVPSGLAGNLVFKWKTDPSTPLLQTTSTVAVNSLTVGAFSAG